MTTMRKRILILGCNDRSGLAVLRSLGRAGWEVDVGWSAQESIVTRSRYLRAVHDIPPPGSRDWLESLCVLMREHHYDLVLPCDDPAVIAVQQHRETLSAFGRIYTLEENTFLTCFDKHRTTLLAERCGVRVPCWSFVQTLQDLDQVSEGWSLPLIVKPVSSFDLSCHGQVRRSVRKLYDRRELRPTCEAMLRDGPLLVQENFTGRGVGVEVLAKDGTVLAAFQHGRVHEPCNGGGSSYRRSEALDPKLLAASETLIRATGYTGVVMVEFRVNPVTDDWILVEINGRFWGSLPLAIAAGMNFPRFLVEMLLDGRTEFPRTYRKNLYARNLSDDVIWFRQNLRANKRDATLQTVPLHKVAAEIVHVLTLSERIDSFTLDDPVPGLHELRRIGAVSVARMAAFASARNPARALLKPWRARQARALMARARNVLFVCKGNICRSPFAEHWARNVFPPCVTVASAGFHPVSGREAPQNAQATASEQGIALAPHRSRVISQAMVEAADVIILFDRDNERDMARQFPHALGKVVRLGDFMPGLASEVADPWGHSRERFGDCYRDISPDPVGAGRRIPGHRWVRTCFGA